MPQQVHPAVNHHVTIMRTLDQNGGFSGHGERKPSKLEQMRLDYQKKLMKEKEEKMLNLYEENQRKAMTRLARNGSGGEQMPVNGAGSPSGGKSVRDFFNERRRLERTGGPVPSIDTHYKQAKGYASPGGWSNRTGSGNSISRGNQFSHGEKKSSAGRDRAQPLAPIQRKTNLATETSLPPQPNGGLGSTYTISGKDSQHARSGIPLRQNNQNALGGAGEENPFNARPRLLKHRPLPPTANGHGAGDNPGSTIDATRARQGKPPAQPSSLPRYNNSTNNRHNPHPHPQPPQQQTQRLTQQQIQQQYQTQKHTQQPPREPHPPPGNKQGNNRLNSKIRTATTKTAPVANGDRKGSGKLTDFQKWQQEQDKTREDRLKKLNQDKPVADSNDGYWGQIEQDDDDDDYEENNKNAEKELHNPRPAPVINGRMTNKDRLSRLNGQRHMDDENDEEEEEEEDEYEGEEDIPEEDEDVDEDDNEDPVKAQERALLEQIAAKQREMERLKKEREVAEEEEKKELALRKKREAAERARQKKLDEERRKEEERQRKLEEEEEREDRKREEQRQRDDEKRRKEEEKRHLENDKRKKEEERRAAKRQAEEEKRQAKLQKQQASARRTPATASDYHSYDDDDDYNSREKRSSRYPDPPDSSRSPRDLDDKPVIPAGSDAKFYQQAAASSDAKGSVGSLTACRQCGRKFASDRIKKHQDACVKANKPRKEFNAAQKRVEGTEMAKYTGRNRKTEPPKKKSNWRAQHEQFIESLRYAKKVTAIEKEGGDLKNLAPPPPSNNPDYVACPHCGRSFNETAAERHIPRCQSLKTRPAAFNTRKR